LPFLGIGFHDEVEPTPFEIKFAVSQCEMVDLGNVQALEPQAHVKRRAIGKGVEGHDVFKPEMEGTVFDNRAINLERENGFDDLQPLAAAAARLRFGLPGVVHEVDLGLDHSYATDHLALD
jgi:hypothetical protein